MGFGKDNKGAIIRETIQDEALAGLSAHDAVKFAGPVITEDFRLLKTEVVAMVNALTQGQGEGMIFGIANGELTAAEIEEAIEANGPLDRNDRQGQERSERNVKILGVSRLDGTSTQTEKQFENVDGGLIMVSKHRWTYSNPEGWAWFIYNPGGTLTTGSTLQLSATHYGVWVT